MRIAITGIGSMVGFHLAKSLLEQKQEVIGLDIQENQDIIDLTKYKNFIFSKVDISDLEIFKKSINRVIPVTNKISKRVDIIYHLAAVSSEKLVKENIPRAMKINVLGTLNCLEVARDLGAKLIYASSAAIYSHPERGPKETEANFSGKFYGTTKFIGEEFCRLYAQNFNLIFSILRFARIYGPKMARNPIYDMTVAFTKGQPIKLYESSQCAYDFIYIKDVINALIMAQNEKWDNQEINIGTGKAIALQEIYELFCKLTGKRLRIEVINDKKSQDFLNIDKAKVLGWQPTYSLTEGLKETLEYFENQLKAESGKVGIEGTVC